MLCVFKNGVVRAPRELQIPDFGRVNLKDSNQTLKDFLAANPFNALSLQFDDNGFLGFSLIEPGTKIRGSNFQSLGVSSWSIGFTVTCCRLFCAVNDVYCVFVGSLNNLSSLNKQYGLGKGANEANFIIEAYCTLRDRNPFPAHRVLQEMEGSFGFVVYDHKAGTVFAAVDADREVSLLWGVTADGAVMITDQKELIKASCGKSFAPFPAGCMFHSEIGLISYEHPKKEMKAVPRIDSQGAIAGACFAVDVMHSKVNSSSIPRIGSEANWSNWS